MRNAILFCLTYSFVSFHWALPSFSSSGSSWPKPSIDERKPRMKSPAPILRPVRAARPATPPTAAPYRRSPNAWNDRWRSWIEALENAHQALRSGVSRPLRLKFTVMSRE